MDVDGDALTITSIDGTAVSVGDTVTLSSGVRVTFQGGTSVVVDGPIQTLGTFVETFDYDVSDGNGGTDSATVSLDLTVNALSVAGLDGTNGVLIKGFENRAELGFWVSEAGDVNGDGVGDIIVSGPKTNSGANDTGEAYVIFGSDTLPAIIDPTALDGTDGFRIPGFDNGAQLGRSVSGAGDFNNDGIDDIVVGAWLTDGGGVRDTGEAYIIFGTDQGFPASVDVTNLGAAGITFTNTGSRDHAGWNVSDAGDINNDGIDDVVIGAWSDDPNGQSNAGSTFVVFGTATPVSLDLESLDGTNGFRVDGVDPAIPTVDVGDGVGYSNDGPGDVNGDGIDDLIIGAIRANGDLDTGAGEYNSGETYVIFGSNDAFPASISVDALDGTNGVTYQGANVEDRSGYSVAGAGDINGDGIQDFLIGSRFLTATATWMPGRAI